MEKTTLYHPILAPKGKTFDPQHAIDLMARVPNGGWSDKPIEGRKAKTVTSKVDADAPLSSLTENQDAANGSTDQRIAEEPGEKGGNTEGN